MRPRTCARRDQQKQGVLRSQLLQLVGSLSTTVGEFKIKRRIFLYPLRWREGQYKQNLVQRTQTAIEGAFTVTRLRTASGVYEGDEGGERVCVLKRLGGDKMRPSSARVHGLWKKRWTPNGLFFLNLQFYYVPGRSK